MGALHTRPPAYLPLKQSSCCHVSRAAHTKLPMELNSPMQQKMGTSHTW